ncbi:hypothetical protein SAMN05421505_12018 [Sinosporangium album]|uniref:Uncharacterized protein n=1 Tax=Sinosporangium album TaxID=504805 RepID=A0A1G8EAY3_9ACTN|nr:hypothetical protein [Sinosporangium album]SDH67054.1 hypothetical protein SAMN05421505_12018 [Sinosporangium album]
MKLTPQGRAACRAGGLDVGRAGTRRKGMLSETLWGMMVQVWEAGQDGLAVRYSGGAWEQFTGREPAPYMRVGDNPDGRYSYRMHLTDAGRDHYRVFWDAYAVCYQGVAAPHPDGVEVWPSAVDDALARLGAVSSTLSAEITGSDAAAGRLAGLAEALPEVGWPSLPKPTDVPLSPDIARAVGRRDRAAAAARRAVEQAAARYKAAVDRQAAKLGEVLAAHAAALEEPYRTACIRYALAAAAVVQAAAAGRDPVAALKVDPATVRVWPRLPDAPVTGDIEIDFSLTRAWTAAGGRPAKRGRSRKTAPAVGSDLMRECDALTGYADAMAGLVAGGKLLRLLARHTSR